MGYTIFLNNRKNVTSDCDQDTANLHLEDSYSDSKSQGLKQRPRFEQTDCQSYWYIIHLRLSLVIFFHTSLISYSENT